jgi:serine/threonine-protein kinase
MAKQPEQSLVGTKVDGKYRIDRVIGRGAMGIVCEARNLDLGRRVAIKLIASSLAENPQVAKRFRREGRATSAIESDHIVRVFDVGSDPEHGLYMVMEYLSGEDLDALLRRVKRLDVEVAARIALQTARALAKAHAAGVVHRDLKPANVFLTQDEEGGLRVKVLDFGISKLLEPDLARTGSLRLTQAGTVIGSPRYSSPEQIQALDGVDHRTDIWSLGIVLYEMLAGRAAYPGKVTYDELYAKITSTTPEPLAQVAPWVPAALAEVVGDALRHVVAERIPDAATFAKRIAKAAPGATAESGEQAALSSAKGASPEPGIRDTQQMKSPFADAGVEQFPSTTIVAEPPHLELETSPILSAVPSQAPAPRAPRTEAPRVHAPVEEEPDSQRGERFDRRSLPAPSSSSGPKPIVLSPSSGLKEPTLRLHKRRPLRAHAPLAFAVVLAVVGVAALVFAIASR